MSIPELCPPQFLNGGSSYSNKEIVALRVKVFLFFSSLKFYRQSEHDLVSVAGYYGDLLLQLLSLRPQKISLIYLFVGPVIKLN